MKSTLVIVATFIAFAGVPSAFANEKRVTSPRGGECFAEALKAYEAAKLNRAAEAAPVPALISPPKRPWIGHTVTISDSERHVIRAYVTDRIDASKGGKFNGVPQGLAKKVSPRGGLPEGWQKSCHRGQVLPAEVHRHCQPLPYDIVVKLPPPPPGTVLLAVDGTIVRIGYPTYEILDVFNVL